LTKVPPFHYTFAGVDVSCSAWSQWSTQFLEWRRCTLNGSDDDLSFIHSNEEEILLVAILEASDMHAFNNCCHGSNDALVAVMTSSKIYHVTFLENIPGGDDCIVRHSSKGNSVLFESA
jgi:hypothetical protein